MYIFVPHWAAAREYPRDTPVLTRWGPSFAVWPGEQSWVLYPNSTGGLNTKQKYILFLLSGCSVVSNSLQPHGLQRTMHPCPSPSLGVCSNTCPSVQWCCPTISCSVVPFTSCLQSFPASGSFQVSQFLASGVRSIETSALASVLPMNIQDWFPSGLTGLIFLQAKGPSRVFSNNKFQK